MNKVKQSLSPFGATVLMVEWEAKAAQCEQTAEQFRAVTKGLACSYLEKARAYRKCADDLRKQMEHETERRKARRP